MSHEPSNKSLAKKVVITGIGLVSPLGNSLVVYRQSLLNGKSGICNHELYHLKGLLAGKCDFDPLKYQSRKQLKRSTRSASMAVYCSREAFNDAGLVAEEMDRSRVAVIMGTADQGSREFESELINYFEFKKDLEFWSHYAGPRCTFNNPPGEVCINMDITGPHFSVGGACASANIAIFSGIQQLQLGLIDVAIVGGVSEACHSFGMYAAFKSQGALASSKDPTKACRPFDSNRNGIVISEGCCLLTLERLDDALKRKAKIYGEIEGYSQSSDAMDHVFPCAKRQAECMNQALKTAQLQPEEIDLINTHATGTVIGDIEESKAIKSVFGCDTGPWINNTKSMIGHTMGAASSLELAGNLSSFHDGLIHPTINLEELDPECGLKGLVIDHPKEKKDIQYIMNNSFGLMGVNSILIVKKHLKEK